MNSFIRKVCFRNFKSFHRLVDGDRSELKRILITLQFLLIAIVGLLIFTMLDAFFGLLFNAMLDLVAISSFLGAFYLVNRHYLQAGKLVIFTSGNLVLLLNASSQGRQAGNYFIFFPIVISIFTLFSYREWRPILFCSVISLANFLFLEFTDYSYLKTPDLPAHYGYVNYLAGFFVSMAMVGYFIYYHAKANTETESKLQKANQRLKGRNQALLKTNGELDSFVYKASHDLRAPLTSLLGLISISQMETDPEKLKYYVQLQEKLIRKLDTYILDILTLSRNSNLAVELNEIDFEETIRQALDQLKYLDNFSRIETSIVVHQPASPFYSDQKRIRIVFNNLLSNAFRYADLSKEHSWLRIELRVQEKEATLVVMDNGIGIASPHLSKIFQMFYRATDRSSGSGLGLYIVREITERLQGKITVSSTVGQGTRFEVHLPNALAKQPTGGPLSQPTAGVTVYA